MSGERGLVLENVDRDGGLIIVWLSLEKVLSGNQSATLDERGASSVRKIQTVALKAVIIRWYERTFSGMTGQGFESASETTE